jgi:hypothetical protein
MTSGSIDSKTGALRSVRGEDHMSTEADIHCEANRDKRVKVMDDFILMIDSGKDQEFCVYVGWQSGCLSIQ